MARAVTASPAAPAETGAVLCRRCRLEPPLLARGRSAAAYDGAMRQLLHALKYDGRRRLADGLGALMRERCAEVLEGADLVVPVPLHWRRRLVRGFNQADDLARRLGLPVCHALRRARFTRPQFGLGDRQRRTNVRGAFAPRRRGLAPGPGADPRRVARACVVLVDDLTTTGATLRECAEVLKELGAREVRAITAARALSQRH